MSIDRISKLGGIEQRRTPKRPSKVVEEYEPRGPSPKFSTTLCLDGTHILKLKVKQLMS